MAPMREVDEAQELPFLSSLHDQDGPVIHHARDRAPPVNMSRFTRRHVIVAGIALILLAALLLPTSSRSRIAAGPSTDDINASTNPLCSNARSNPHNVQAPVDIDPTAITSIWPDLKQALSDHKPEFRLARPPWRRSFPSEDDIKYRTKLLNNEIATALRQKHTAFVNDIPAYPKDAFRGKGVVMLAGGRYSEFAATSLGMLRESGSTLPVEVWRLDEREEKHGWCHEIEAEGMACRRLSDYMDTDILEIKDGRAMKVFVMLFSSFEEIIFIDADNMALRPPELLFEHEVYKETGAILWPDFWTYDNIDWLYYIVGASDGPSEELWKLKCAESGEMLWDKKRHWRSLVLATYYNYHGPDLYYTLLNYGYAGYGDKDTFPLALRALNEPFHFVHVDPESSWSNGRKGNRRVGMMQMTPKATTASESQAPVDQQGQREAFFHHSTTIKWSHRDFLCIRCLPIRYAGDPNALFVSAIEDSTHELFSKLLNFVRVIDEDSLLPFMPNSTGDAEVRMWRAMEYAACRSKAWRHPRACEFGRRYVVKTFGMGFVDARSGQVVEVNTDRDERDSWVPGMEEDVCLVDPPPVDREALDAAEEEEDDTGAG
ncbi:glycosyltransferase family 71 protein [Teratosphaeria destructans]|uniref:Glycosyltransferase family 71 protein n=1 Tax=Teratosphaeria destructans TaxID=418781 RepID=A0A9W7VYS2_9PEZI|nr:glycosyltransferase family 71 protein [Teratosphaeria destructans]